jgi:hypothetical protein
VRNGATWTPQTYLKASNTGSEDRFGRSVAISGDTVVVGAASEDSGASGVNGNQSDNTTTNAGAVYVFNDAGERAQRGPDFLVTSLAGDNDGLCGVDDCTLADAVHAANENPDASIISFAPGLSGTITNSRAAGMPLRSEITIAGPGARLLTVSGGNTARLFNVNTSGFVSLRRLTLAQGRAGGATFPGNCGGAIFAAGGVVGLSDCAIVGNTSAVHGGAIYNSGIDGFATLFASECTFSKNVASASGGAVFNAGYNGQATVSLLNATLDGNEAKQIGGAIYNDGTVNGKAHVSLKNCTLNGNSAAAQAGGIYNDAFNPDSTGTASVTLANTILNRGASGANLVNERGTMVSEGHNLSSDAAGGLAGSAPAGFLNATNDRRNTDPRLAPLANNGGPTDTIALLSDSPAIDAANDSTAPSTDQRGFKRVGVSDIGAFEFGGTEPTATPTRPPPTPTPTPIPVPKLGNIATRVRVETGENVLIGGMIITGSQPKRLILRAVGPSLDVTGALTNPQLEIYRGDELIAGNDNWREASNEQEIFDSTVAPSSELESAILTTLPPGVYTAIVSGVGGETGVGSVEAYDLDLTADSSFGNISTRGRVLTDANVMIGGVIVAGSTAQKVIVRAIGPSLGVIGQLEDPLLELYDREGNLLQSNDNWRDTQQAEIEATTIPPSNDLESSIVGTLPPALYTAIVRGVNDSTGVALVEVYALQ